MMKKVPVLISVVIVIFLVSTTISEAFQDTPVPEISQIHRNIAEISDTDHIQTILDDFLIPADAEEIDRIEIIDVSDIGFGDNDILVIYPSLDVHMIDQPSPDLAETMRQWNLDEQRMDADIGLDADYFYPGHADTLPRVEVQETEIELVQNSIVADLLESIDRNYQDPNLSLRFERDEEGFTFQIWNYEEDAFAFNPRPPATPDTILVNDFLYMMYSDSTVAADTTLHDIMYINKTVEETIYMPPEPVTEEIQTQNLPGENTFDIKLHARSARTNEDD